MQDSLLTHFRNAVTSDNRTQLRKKRAYNEDLRAVIETDVYRAIKQTGNIAERFRAGNIRDTCHKLHRFLRRNIIYLKDDSSRQQIKLPSALLRDLTGDCKSYSVFAAAILYNLNFPRVCFKYAGYNTASKIPSHIYVQCNDEYGNTVIIDGTNPHFDSEKQPVVSIIKELMTVETLSGLDSLANEVLADETLTGAASKQFRSRLRLMNKRQRMKFLSKFSGPNRLKLLKSLRKKHKQHISEENSDFGFGVAGIENIAADNSIDQDESLAGKKGKARRKERRTQRKAIKTAKKKFGKHSKEAKAAKAVKKKRIRGRVKKVAGFLNRINPGLAVARGSFIGLVAINLRGYATALKIVLDGPQRGKIEDKWKFLGGKVSKLKKAANNGAKKKAFLGTKKSIEKALEAQKKKGLSGEDLGNPAAAIAAAGAIIGALMGMVTGILKATGHEEVAKKMEAAGSVVQGATSAASGDYEGASSSFQDATAKFADNESGEDNGYDYEYEDEEIEGINGPLDDFDKSDLVEIKNIIRNSNDITDDQRALLKAFPFKKQSTGISGLVEDDNAGLMDNLSDLYQDLSGAYDEYGMYGAYNDYGMYGKRRKKKRAAKAAKKAAEEAAAQQPVHKKKKRRVKKFVEDAARFIEEHPGIKNIKDSVIDNVEAKATEIITGEVVKRAKDRGVTALQSVKEAGASYWLPLLLMGGIGVAAIRGQNRQN